MVESRQKAALEEARLLYRLVSTHFHRTNGYSFRRLSAPVVVSALNLTRAVLVILAVRGACSALHPVARLLGLFSVTFFWPSSFSFCSLYHLADYSACRSRKILSGLLWELAPNFPIRRFPARFHLVNHPRGSPKDTLHMRIWLVSTTAGLSSRDATASSPCSWESLTCFRRPIVRTFRLQGHSALQGEPYGGSRPC